MSISYWNEVLDEDQVLPSSDRRVGSVPHKQFPKIDDYFNESSEGPLPAPEENARRGRNANVGNSGSVLMVSPTHRRSRSLNSNDAPYIDVSFAIRNPKNLLPNDLQDLYDAQSPAPSLEIYESILESDNQDKISKADRALKRLLTGKTDPKDKGKILRAVAEINKRNFLFNDAIHFYEKATQAEPSNTQNYLDHSKLLEELGQIEDAEKILKNGLFKSSAHEQLTPKLVKMFERRQKFDSVRKILGLIYKTIGLPGATLSLLEGVLFEVRHGDIRKAQNVLAELEKVAPLKNNFYVDLSEDTRRRGYYDLAMQCAKNGLDKYSTMPSNWTHFISIQRTAKDTLEALNNASSKLSVSSLSKISQIAAFQCARLGDIHSARKIIADGIAGASADQRWRYLYNASVIETLFGSMPLVENLLNLAMKMTPQKSLSTVMMALAKYYEQIEDISKAKQVYKILKKEQKSDWRIYLEYTLFLVRQNKRAKALKNVKKALNIHQSTGRLWALYVQLEEESKQPERLKSAILSAPKSGEIWVEAARIAMNPVSPYFNLKNAEFYLTESFLFTPQYVDIFIEMIRLELLKGGLNVDLSHVHDLFLSGEGNYGTVIYMYRKPGSEFTQEEFNAIVDGVRNDIIKHASLYSHAIARSSFVIESVRHELELLDNEMESVPPFSFSFGISSFFDVVSATKEKNPSPELTEIRKSLIFGSSMVML